MPGAKTGLLGSKSSSRTRVYSSAAIGPPKTAMRSTASTRMTSKHFYRALVMSVFDLQTHMHASLRLLAIANAAQCLAHSVYCTTVRGMGKFFVAAEHGLDVGQPVNFCAPSNRVPRFPVPPSAPKLRGQTSPLLP